jgi:3-phosphoshikimate 1-carboxyvinyltransferase
MRLIVNKTEKLRGEITIPASKSHTIRAVIIASLAKGMSRIINPLISEDTKAAINVCQSLGTKIETKDNELIIDGFGNNPKKPSETIDMLNSGASTNLMLSIFAVFGIEATFTGDASLKARPVKPLADALVSLGANINYLEKEGCPPLKISGKIKAGLIKIDGSKSSQYISSLLLSCPLLSQDTEIMVENPTEVSYIEMTLRWLDEQNIKYERDGFLYPPRSDVNVKTHSSARRMSPPGNVINNSMSLPKRLHFKIFGNQSYKPFEKTIPGDWSSATFPICAAALTNSEVLVKGADINDVQGDKAVIDYLKKMGADITIKKDGILIKGTRLKGKELDINATPDALPAMSVIGCFAEGQTKLFNAAQARVKETDRIKVMTKELKLLNADIEELSDGVITRKSGLKGVDVNGHNDHRVVMALSIAGLIAEGQTIIDSAESIDVTYPGYVESMKKTGARFKLSK